MNPVERDLTLSWWKDDKYFEDQLKIGKDFEVFVANKLKKAGIANVIHQNNGDEHIKSEVSKHTKYSTDLLINGWSFEVKSRSEVFTSPEDWRYWPMFVDTVSSLDKKKFKPRGYIFVSQKTGALMSVGINSKEFWTTQKKWDSKRKISDTFYCVEKKYVTTEETLIKRLKELKPFEEDKNGN